MIKLNFRKLFMMGLGMVIVLVFTKIISSEEAFQNTTSAYILKPFSDEMVLITSAGQSTDTYILQDIFNELRINNLFMPTATTEDISDISAIIIVVGFSDVGIRLHDKDFSSESKRVKDLIEEGKAKKLPIITIYLGGYARRDEHTDALLNLTCSNSDYIICTTSGNNDHFIEDKAAKFEIPLSLIENVNDLSKPLASVFR